MARERGQSKGKLKAVAVKALAAAGKPGAHADGGNLYLRVAAPGRATWTMRYMIAGRSREMSLGRYDEEGETGLTLAMARDAAAAARQALRDGADPIAKREAAAAAAEAAAIAETAAARTFAEAAEVFLVDNQAGWRNTIHKRQWRSTLAAYVHPHIGARPVVAVSTEDVLACLKPLWTTKPETASRVRGRIEAILDAATSRGWRQGLNPARWRGHLDNLLPARAKVRAVQHHAALPWQDMATFMAQLRQREGMGAMALQMAILTACRSGEVLGARWSEIDLSARLWTIPARRMKAGREHRVPISPAALALLEKLAVLRDATPDALDHVFPGAAPNRPLSVMAMAMVLRRMQRDALTVHGFRSTFRDWCEEATSTPHAVAEACLAHTIPDAVERAYRRGDLLEKRRAVMEQWAEYCDRKPAEVVQLRPAAIA